MLIKYKEKISNSTEVLDRKQGPWIQESNQVGGQGVSRGQKNGGREAMEANETDILLVKMGFTTQCL